MKRKRGMPIGSYMSQPFGNFILSMMDHAIKEELKVKCYHRYCDDAVALCKTKAEARHVIKEIDRMSLELGLVIKASSFIAPIQTRVHAKKKRKRQRGRKKD